MSHIPKWVVIGTGLTIGATMSIVFTYYMFALHEARLWFSNIQEVEREISFRTESGLYYAFYKEALLESTWHDVFHNLLHDQFTEAPIEINILKRFNVYQELLLAWFYSVYNSIVISLQLTSLSLTPIFFYTYACFVFSGLAIGAVFTVSWRLSGNFLFGALTAFWTFADIDDATRVFFTVNLRENFALPFFWFANSLIIDYLRLPEGITHSKDALLLLTTFLFSLFWQFNQFILLLQSGALIASAYLCPASVNQIVRIFLIQLVAYVLLIAAQFGQSMLLSSLYLWIAISATLVFSIFPPKQNNSIKNITKGVLTILIFAVIASNVTKTVFAIDSDTHIWTFVKAKLGLIATGDELPFETALYICHGAFAFIDPGFWTRTTTYGMLPLYGITVAIVIANCIWKLLKPSVRFDDADAPFFNAAVVFLTIESVLIGCMAVLTLRMKYVWFPHVAILGAHALKLLDPFLGKYPKYAVIFGISWLIATNQFKTYKQQVANEQEFYDPDTVALMKWISTETTPDSIFSGSMQLMAGVRCCTTRPISNHPHFEDAFLRARTERLYAIYGTTPLSDVHAALCHESVDYIVLEDSICLAPLKNGCSTNEIVDAAAARNGRPFGNERVCQAVKAQSNPEVRQFFKQVFENRTFRVYRVNCHGS